MAEKCLRAKHVVTTKKAISEQKKEEEEEREKKEKKRELKEVTKHGGLASAHPRVHPLAHFEISSWRARDI